jgi:beta-lactamase class A
MRLACLIALAALTLAGCEKEPLLRQLSQTPQIHGARLDQEVGAIADRARPAVLGVGVRNLESGEIWLFNGERRFPMQGAYALVLAAAVLAEVDAGRLSLDDSLPVREQDLSPPPSAVAAAWPSRQEYKVSELLAAATQAGDSTAADLLLKRIGGPGAVTAWLAQKRIFTIRVDRYARERAPQALGLESFRPAWRDEAAFLRAVAAIPPIRRQAAATAFLQDPRDTANPRGMADLLAALQAGELLSPASTERLLQLIGSSAEPTRIAAGLQRGSTFAHASGAARRDLGVTIAADDAGVATLADGRRYAVAVFLSGAPQEPAARDAIFAEVARAVARGVK